MAQYSIRLDTVHLLSTANPDPYWDELVLVASLDRIATVDGERRVVGSAGVRTAFVGGMGKGAKKSLNSVQPEGGPTWEIDVPDPEPGEEIQLSVNIRNVRGLGDQAVARLISKIVLLAAEITAAIVIPAASKAGKIAKDAGIGISGFILDKVIDEIFPDPPSCNGLVMKESFAANPLLLAGREYDNGGFSGNVHSSQVQEWLIGDLEDSPGEDCGRPSAKVQYTIKKAVHLSFGSPVTFENSYGALDTLRIDNIVGTWVDVKSVSSALPKVKVGIGKSGIPLKDSLNVSVEEIIFGKNNYVTTAVKRQFTDLSLELMDRLIPGKEVFGEVQPNGLLTTPNKYPFASMMANGGQQNGSGQSSSTFSRVAALSNGEHLSETVVAGVSPDMDDPHMRHIASGAASSLRTLTAFPNELEIPDSQMIPFDLYGVSLFSEIRKMGLGDHQIYTLLRRTICLPLPNGIVLSFWAMFTYVNGKLDPKPRIAIRYTRDDNIIATRTDCWLAPWSPVK